jgi:hypothetical protein
MIARILYVAGTATTTAIASDAFAATKRSVQPAKTPAFILLSAVADTIVPRTDTPGAVDAHVPALYDGLMKNWASPQRRIDLAAALTRIDAKAQVAQGKGFAELSPSVRHDLLSDHDKLALKVLPAKPGTRGGAVELMAGPNYADADYAKMKELIVLLYYLSEPALTQELIYVHAPGEWKPSIPVTPDTRPAGGTMF